MTDSPTPAQIKAARKAMKLSQTEAARLVHRSLRPWQYWESGEEKMDPALWELFLFKTKQRQPCTE